MENWKQYLILSCVQRNEIAKTDGVVISLSIKSVLLHDRSNCMSICIIIKE